ncbi:MAG: anti-sigma factor antagonist [Solirubrobacteraceae bacterium]|jgi:anti-sigma B factor antagonist|nr:anti-sigma factor antagonist [Solirubrobacteraceae bacterium]
MAIDFSVWDEQVDDTTQVVAVRGEIDIFTAPEFKERISAAIDAGRDLVIVDLGATTFIDSSSLGVLISAHRRLTARDGRLVIACDVKAVLNTFKITGLDGVLEIVAARDDALTPVDERAA